MAFGTITVTESTFGSISGTVVGAIPGTLSGSVGVPGPQGPAGSQGPQGDPGQGVPAGGTAGQYLQKTSGDDYATDWVTLDVSGKRDLTDYDFTNVADTKLTTYGLTLTPPVGTVEPYNSFLDADELKQSYDESNGGTQVGYQVEAYHGTGGVLAKFREWTDNEGTIEPSLGESVYLGLNLLRFGDWSGNVSSSIWYQRTAIRFGNGSTQTIAFPGFANAALTGNPTAPTAALGDNDTSIATTAFVQQELLSGTANARNLEVQVRNQSGSMMAAGSIVYISGATGNLPLITKAQANNDANSAQTIGFVKTPIANNGTGYVIVRGVLENIDTSALTEGVQLYLSPTTAGTWTTSKPSAPEHLVYVGVVIRSHPTLGTILVAVQNGYELHELHDVALSSEANNDLLVYELSTDLWKNKSFSTLGLATLNSPTFTGTPSLPTGTTAVTQSAGNNTTALATTAFVQTSNPDASTTTKGHVELATDADARLFTSTTKAMTPRNVIRSMLSQDFVDLIGTSMTVTNTGTITYVQSGQLTRLIRPGTAGACSSRIRTFGTSQVDQTWPAGSRVQPASVINFSLRSIHSGRSSTAGVTDANYTCAFYFGKVEADGTGDLVRRGYGWKMVGGAGSRFLQLQAHNGTTLSSVTSSFAVTSGVAFDWDIESDGAGNVTLYVNGSSVATSTGGPTGITTSSTAVMWQEEFVATAALSSPFMDFANSRGRYIVINTW